MNKCSFLDRQKIDVMIKYQAYVDKANERLQRRFYEMKLNRRFNRNVAATAIVRELACFMWVMAIETIS